MPKECGNCVYWEDDKPGWEPDWASCKRFPPVTARINRTCPKQLIEYEFCYPTTRIDQTCGEHRQAAPT